MKKISKLLFAIGMSGAPLAVMATPFDGIYSPAAGYTDWSCNADDLGMDGGAVGIVDGFLQGVENACELTSPTNIRGMDAILYDAVCSGEGETYSYRLMLMKHDGGVYLVQNGFVSDWRSCK